MELKITLDRTGNVSVEGPLDQKMLCYGMLEAAKDAIRSYEPKSILIASPGATS